MTLTNKQQLLNQTTNQLKTKDITIDGVGSLRVTEHTVATYDYLQVMLMAGQTEDISERAEAYAKYSREKVRRSLIDESGVLVFDDESKEEFNTFYDRLLPRHRSAIIDAIDEVNGDDDDFEEVKKN